MDCLRRTTPHPGPDMAPDLLPHIEVVDNFVKAFMCMSTPEAVWFYFQFVFALWLFVLVNASIYMSTIYLPRLRRSEDAVVEDLPVVAVVIPCYLPNETDVIEETLKCVCCSEYQGELMVAVPYNTPDPMPQEEQRLKDITSLNERVVSVERVEASASKAENVMYAVSHMSNEDVDMVVVFDADHRPEPYTVSRMVTLLAQNPECVAVQGSVHVVRGGPAWLRWIAGGMEWVAWNFYAPGMSLIAGSAWFAGANAVWRYSDLKDLGMDRSCMTEDVDLSIRAILEGHRILLAPWARVGEVCPSGPIGFVRQRLRWGMGWEQVTFRMIPRTFMSSSGFFRKFRIVLLLLARYLSTGAGIFAICDAVSRAVNHVKNGSNAIALPISIMSSVSGHTSASAAISIIMILAFNGEDMRTALKTLTFLVMSPVFVAFQLYTIVHSWASLMCFQLYWVPTARSASRPTHRIALKQSMTTGPESNLKRKKAKKHKHVRLPKDTIDPADEI